jgi:hypothetical protein
MNNYEIIETIKELAEKEVKLFYSCNANEIAGWVFIK